MAYGQAFAPEWRRFHTAIVAGTMQGEIPAACERAWAWLDLRAEDRTPLIKAAIHGEAAARWQLQALPFVRRRLLHEAGMSPDDGASTAAFFEAMAAGRASAAELELSRRLNATLAMAQVVTELFPGAALPPPATDRQQEELLARTPALTHAMHACEVARTTPQALAQLHAAIVAFDAAGADACGDMAREQAWWLGLAWWTAGRAALELGRQDEARDAYERARAQYTQAADAQAAQDCRDRLRELAERRAGDFDSAAQRHLSALLVRRDPMGRAQALTQLVRENSIAGDRFEAARLAAQATQVLADAGYPDPESGFDEAAQRWVNKACESRTGNALIARLCEVAQCWAAILGARISARLQEDPFASEHAELVLQRIPAWVGELMAQATNAEDEAAQRFAPWNRQQTELSAERRQIDPSMERNAALTTLDGALADLRSACNEHADAAQLDEARALQARAGELGSRLHLARAWLEQAYVLQALQRAAESAAPAQHALDILLSGAEPRLSAFATGYERELYLTAIIYKARALAASRDNAAIIALCEPVLRDLEGERLRVSSPYQQSAFLATRTELYEFVAAAAYNTQRLDLLLAVSELLKARLALRSRLAPGTPDDSQGDELDAQLHSVNAELQGTAAGSDEERSLRERRRWLFTARAIRRASAGADMPEITVAALQAVLAPQEAAITWFWIGTSALIVLAVSADRTQHLVIKLDADSQARLDDYVECMHALAAPQPRFGMLIPRLDALIAALGPVLLPQGMRDFVHDKARLILCPHRSLHLFAFHAVAHNGTALGASYAIRYMPSLSSLLLPWQGNGQGAVLAVGVRQFDDPALPILPNAEAEAQTVATMHGPNGQALTGVTRAQFITQFMAQPLPSLRCLHLATHGSSVLAGAAADDPLDCALYLRDGALTGWDLTGLRLPAELVVLASCHSAQRAVAGRGLDRLPGDDLFGLPAILCEAGVHQLLGALWPAQDAAAHTIVSEFHRAYAGGAEADAALRDAIRAYLADTTQPHEAFFWAPFTLTAFGRRA